MSRITTAVFRFSMVSAFAAATACASAAPTLSVRDRFVAALDSLGYDTIQLAGPRVAISTQSEPFHTRRITPRIHVVDDAYVTVVNVWPSGEASVIWPESPEDDGFLAGGRTYAISSLFSGFATVFPPTGAQGLRFVRFSRSSDARMGARGPGYMILIASHAPLDLEALDTAGYFGDVSFGSDLRAMEPSAVIPQLAVLAGGGRTALTLDHARYGGYDMLSTAARSSSFASRSSRRCGLGYHGNPALWAWDAEFGAAGCGMDPYGEPMRPRWFVPRPPPIPPDTGRPPADTLHTPEQRAAVQAAWADLLRREASRAAGRELVTEDDVVELPRSGERRPFDDVEQRRAREGSGADDTQRERRRIVRPRDIEQIDRAPRRVAPPVPRREEARPTRPRDEPRPQPAPRAEQAPPRAAPAPRHVDPAPKPQPAGNASSSDPKPQP